MKRLALGGLGLLVALLLVLLVAGLGGPGDKTASNVATTESATDAPFSMVAGKPSAAAPALPTTKRVRHTPTEEEVGFENMNVLLAREIPSQLLRIAARECYRDDVGRMEGITVRYTVRFSKGKGSFDDVTITQSEVNNPALEGCIVDVLSSHTWSDPGAPDLVDTHDFEFTMAGMRKIHQRETGPDPFDTSDIDAQREAEVAAALDDGA